MTVINPTQPTAIVSPINLVTTSGNPVLANKLLAADANNAFQIDGNGTMHWGAGGASGFDAVLKRTAANFLELGDGTNDLKVGYNGTDVVIQALNNNSLDLDTTGSGNLVLNPNGIILLNATLKNGVAGNETATATAGAIASPGNFQGFLSFQDHNGTVRKIPYFAN